MLLRRNWSPEEIAARLGIERGISICHKTIYKFVEGDRSQGGSFYFHLRWGRRRRKKRFHVRRVRNDILHRKHISHRSKIVEDNGEND
jgi:IS30 family transposase